jgi:hypothetical protein
LLPELGHVRPDLATENDGRVLYWPHISHSDALVLFPPLPPSPQLELRVKLFLVPPRKASRDCW